MEHVNLELRFRLAGDDQFQTKRATRIRVDGSGGLTCHVEGAKDERIELGRLQSFCLLSVRPALPKALDARGWPQFLAADRKKCVKDSKQRPDGTKS